MEFMKGLAHILITLAIVYSSAHAQNAATIQDWNELIPFESTRGEVEAILGKPNKYFETYGLYDTEIGSFSVWYSDGKCLKKRKELQYNVKPHLFINLRFSPKSIKSLTAYGVDLRNVVRTKDPHSDRIFVGVPDGPAFEVYPGPGGKELVYAIHISPASNDSRLCKEKDLT